MPPTPRGYVLAEGEATGHAHTIDAVPGVEMYERDGVLYLRVMDTPREVRHEEHNATKSGVAPMLPVGDYVVVRVVDVARNADGSEKVHWLPVHPELRPLLDGGELGEPQQLTARNAVASTFGMRGVEYDPVWEA